MIRYAVVGTGPISRQFVGAAIGQGQWKLQGVLGSSGASGRSFLTSLGPWTDGCVAYGQLSDLATSDDVDVVYVASPNSLHFPMACEALEQGKHVIVEKPAFSNPREWTRAHELAERQGVLLLEAARHLYEDNYQRLRSAVAELAEVTGASLVFRQFSSRVPAYLAGARPRILTAEYSGGALADLGVYPLYAVVDWFGPPVEARYHARLLDTGADAEGVALLGYPDFDVCLAVSKVQSSFQENEVYGSGGSVLAFNGVAAVERLRLVQPGRGDIVVPLAPVAQNPVSPEVAHFTQRLLAYPAEPVEALYTYDRLRQLGTDVIALSERLRRDAGVVFPADRAIGEQA